MATEKTMENLIDAGKALKKDALKDQYVTIQILECIESKQMNPTCVGGMRCHAS